MVEFLVTAAFRRQIGIHEPKNITFCLGGEWCELSLVKFSMRMELYISSEVHTEYILSSSLVVSGPPKVSGMTLIGQIYPMIYTILGPHKKVRSSNLYIASFTN